MGLISELMCKYVCQCNPLPENVVFITAYNLCKIRERKNKNNKIELVYIIFKYILKEIIFLLLKLKFK